MVLMTNNCITNDSKCNGPITAKGLCRRCYKREYRIKNYDKLIEQEKACWHRNRTKNLVSVHRT